MKNFIWLCRVSFIWPFILAFDFVDDCRHLGGTIISENNGWARIGCKAERFGYCTLARNNPPLICKIVVSGTTPSVENCNESNRIKFTGNTASHYCEFLIENLQPEGERL
jgi:hypothetical protein